VFVRLIVLRQVRCVFVTLNVGRQVRCVFVSLIYCVETGEMCVCKAYLLCGDR
jgi:hypothetical protein